MTLTPPHNEPPTQPKRTRICGPQSKNGCFTCKTRRIKCDEERPTCLRCARSNRVCEGYPSRAAVADGGDSSGFLSTSSTPPSSVLVRSTEPSISAALFDGHYHTSQQHYLSRVGCALLGYNADLHFGSSGTVLEVLLPQLSHVIPSVNAAAAALGAIYQAQVYPSRREPQKERLAIIHYGRAVSAMQEDLVRQPYGPIPLLMICVLLALSEIILRREENALVHLHGAFKLLQDHQRATTPDSPDTPQSENSSVVCREDDLTFLFRVFDYQVSSFALSLTPHLAPYSGHQSLSSMTDASSARTHLIPLIHASYHFTSKASVCKYCPLEVTPAILIEQGRHLASLSFWLETLDHAVLPQFSALDEAVPSPHHALALLLRITCLATLIWVSAVLTAHEVDYDAHASRFQQIIIDAARVLSSREAMPPSPILSGRPTFSASPGVIQPLYLAASKYRHPVWRRRAIALIERAGREGPWADLLEATTLKRAVEIEESWASDNPSDTSNSNSFVEERGRIHGIGIADGKDYTVLAHFSRCRNVKNMLSACSSHPTDLRPSDDKAHWELWDERLDIREFNPNHPSL